MDNHKNKINASDIILYIMLAITLVAVIVIGNKLGIGYKSTFNLIVVLEMGVYYVGKQILNKISTHSSKNVAGVVVNNDGMDEVLTTKEGIHEKTILEDAKKEDDFSRASSNDLTEKLNDEKCRKYAQMAAKRLVKETEIPYFKIILEDEKPGLFDSKVGGIPYLPGKVEIPLDSDRNRMKLLAQINCRDLVGLEDYPHEGILQFWLTTKSEWDEIKTIYHREIDYTMTEKDVIYRIAEFNEGGEHGFPVEGEYKMKFELSRESMSRDDYRLKALFCQYYSEISGEDISDPEDASSKEVYEVFEAECMERDGADGIGHKVGGYHYTTQYDSYMCNEYEGETIDIHSDEAELLLFQLDSDYAFVNFETRKHDWVKVMWGDSGVGRFYIKRSDLKRCAFENVWYSWDCS